jgi:hypothetical protein
MPILSMQWHVLSITARAWRTNWRRIVCPTRKIRLGLIGMWAVERITQDGHSETMKPSGHFDMCTTFIKAFNAAGAGMRNVILCNESHTSAVLNACTGISAPLALSERRADFLRVLLATRRRNLERALS